MELEELTPEAVAILKSLVNKPHPMDDSPTLQLLFADRLVMGSLRKVNITAKGGRMLARFSAGQPVD
jgi:hypothetical protein